MDWNFLTSNRDALTVTTDSRKITPGCVFVALKGEHFDGNDFVEQAARDGAAYIIKGEHALEELQDLARAWRRELKTPIIAITGTNGKTTTKELTAAVLSTKFRVHYTQGNYNNSLGVPLTLLQMTREHELAIIEMGASHPGDIKELVEIAEPDYGLITNVGKAHLQGFGDFEGVKATKRELYDYLAAHSGLIFRNADNTNLAAMQHEAEERYGHCAETVTYTTGKMLSGTRLVGDYNSENIQAALCIGARFGVPVDEAEQAVRNYVPCNYRSQTTVTARNTLIVDAYNANPTSMQAAIGAFKGDAYILGTMRELGDYSRTEHQNIVNMLLERKADNVFLVGDEWRQTTAPYPIYSDVNELAAVSAALTAHTILIKGSRSNRLEQIIPFL